MSPAVCFILGRASPISLVETPHPRPVGESHSSAYPPPGLEQPLRSFLSQALEPVRSSLHVGMEMPALGVSSVRPIYRQLGDTINIR